MCVCLLCAYVSLGPDQASGSEFKFSQRSNSESQTTLFDCMTSEVKAWRWRWRWGQGEKTESTDVVIKFKSVMFIQLCIVDSGTHASLSICQPVSLLILHIHTVRRPYFLPGSSLSTVLSVQQNQAVSLFALCASTPGLHVQRLTEDQGFCPLLHPN